MTTALGRRSWFALAALLLIPGCLDFAKQTVLIKFDEKTEKVTILSVYERFHVNRGLSKKDSLKDAKESLSKFVGDEPNVVVFSKWINLNLIPEDDDPPEVNSIKRRLAAVMKIDRGRLLLNERGELSGFQTITIFDRTALVKVVNDSISDLVRSQPSLGMSDETDRLVKEAAKRGHRWVKISVGQVVVDVPMSEKDADKLMGDMRADASTMTSIREAVGVFELSKTDHGIAAKLGDGKNRLMTIQHAFKEKTPKMERELLDFAKTPPMSIDQSQDTRAVMEKFRSSP